MADLVAVERYTDAQMNMRRGKRYDYKEMEMENYQEMGKGMNDRRRGESSNGCQLKEDKAFYKVGKKGDGRSIQRRRRRRIGKRRGRREH